MLQSPHMLKEHGLVLYKGRPAVIGSVGEKIAITVEGGAVVRVREKDVELLHPGPIDNPEAALCGPEGDIDAAWELIQGSTVSLRELAELAYGDFSPQSAWAVYAELKDGLRFSGGVHALNAKTPQERNAEAERRRDKEKSEQERTAFLERLKKQQLSLPDDAAKLQDVEALAYSLSEHSRTIKDLGEKESPEAAHKLLLKLGVWTETNNPHPRRFGLQLSNAKVPLAPPPKEARLDLRGLRAFAIDNEWSDDPDDALSIDGSALWVHVADPAASLKPDSEADKEARGRGTSYYLPEACYRMLGPGALDYFALGIADESPALSFRLTLDKDAAITDVSIHKTLIRAERLSYASADKAAEDASLAPLFALAERLAERRRANGAIDIELPEVHIKVHTDEVSITPILKSRSAALVRECMVAAGQGAALWALRHRLPFPYVSQERGELPADISPAYAGAYQLRRCMRPRRLSTQIGTHEALGLEQYSQVTSPLRRYTDLVAHQQLRLELDGIKPLDEETIMSRVAAAEAAAQAASQAERVSRLHWTLVYVSRHPETIWDAVVVERKGNRATILIPELGMETQTALSGEAALNSVIHVKAQTIRLPELFAAFSVL